jgi:hypothetical protein
MRRLLRSIARGGEITQDISTLENPTILVQLAEKIYALWASGPIRYSTSSYLKCSARGLFLRTGTRTATAQCPRHPSTGPFGGASAVLEIWGTGQTRCAQTAPGSDPKFLRSSSPGLLLGGVGIAPQQRALGAHG